MLCENRILIGWQWNLKILNNSLLFWFAFSSGEKIIFAESPSYPGIPIVYRTPEERSANPDRLNLDR